MCRVWDRTCVFSRWTGGRNPGRPIRAADLFPPPAFPYTSCLCSQLIVRTSSTCYHTTDPHLHHHPAAGKQQLRPQTPIATTTPSSPPPPAAGVAVGSCPGGCPAPGTRGEARCFAA